MHRCLAFFVRNFTMSGDIRSDVVLLLRHHGCYKTVEHSIRVAEESRCLAEYWNENRRGAELAGWLHDISAIIPHDQRIQIAEFLGLDMLPEERTHPMIIHQKLSAALASQLFDVEEEDILSAIGCHTTLKDNASNLDKIVFVADKIAWDQNGDPPYLDEMLNGLAYSLDQGALVYLQFLVDKRDSLPVLHPWVEQAYHQISRNLS